MQQLSKLLHHAYENVPYYRKVFDEKGLKPKDIHDFNNLKELPFLTKEIIRENFNELIAKNIPKRYLKLERTSGSTAAPLSFYYEKGRTQSLEDAFIETLWSRVGYQSKYKRVNLTWELVNKSDSWWEYNPAHRILTLSPYHMKEENLYKYVEKIEQFKPKAIKAIPSTIIVLASFMQLHNISPFPSVIVILLGSEILYPWQRKKIKEVFHSRIFTCYGQAEKVVLAGECEESNKYHIFPEYGVTELIEQNGEQIKQEGERGIIVGTGFNNYAMPFIRYRTGDIAVWLNRKCSCGRSYPLLERIEGREQESIVLKNGDLVPLLALPFTSLFLNVKQFQFYQDKPGKVNLRIVKMPSYTQNDSESILKGLCEGLNDIKIHLEFVSHISRTDRGKYKYMIQKVPIKFGVNIKSG
jgi:phenylacetate-CoA ligase